MAFLIVKYIHILAAITAVGLNISYAIWILRAQREQAHTAFALKGIKFLDDRIANPAYGVLLLTGLLMVVLLPIPITTLWIVIARPCSTRSWSCSRSASTPRRSGNRSSSPRQGIRPQPSSPASQGAARSLVRPSG